MVLLLFLDIHLVLFSKQCFTFMVKTAKHNYGKSESELSLLKKLV